jgi:CAAX protease family protein
MKPGIELLVAAGIIAAGLRLPLTIFALGSAPWLMAIGALCVWWRGPGVRAIVRGTRLSISRGLAVGLVVGVAYQFVGTYAVEPIIVRLTSGTLPDVSQFRGLVGNKGLLMFWITLSWSLAAFVEEAAYRGWILTRCAELGGYSRGAWLGGMVVSSALFGLAHAYQGVSGMVATGLTGLLFAGVYLATGRNLWAAIIAHGSLDTTGFVLMYLGVYPGL